MLAVRLPAGALWTFPTLAALSGRLAADGDGATAARAPVAEPAPAVLPADPLASQVAAMGTSDLMSFLDTLLDDSNRGPK